MPKRVAILGAGVCGIVAIKSCIEDGLEPVCFEKTNKIGGLWNYTGNTEENVASVMKSTITNTSKEMTAFSDFPMPDHYPNYMHHSVFLEYLKLYIDHFKLEKHIKCQHLVTNVKKANGFDRNGEWIVEYKDMGKNGKGHVETERFQAVMICTGHYEEKSIPKFPGAEDFKGRQLHSLDYKNSAGFEGKRIVVVGLGNSAGDVAAELSRVAKQVYMSTRRGGWILQRLTDNGIPMDLIGQRRVLDYLGRLLGKNVMNRILRKKINKQFDHRMYGLEPDHEPLSQHPVINEELPNRIICGAIQIKPNISKMTETNVIFEDGSEVAADVVIYATGYKFGFPFLPTDTITFCKNNFVDLYKYVFPPELNPGTMAVIGCCAPWGSLLPVAELQSRWASRVFAGQAQLPSKQNMLKDIKANQDFMERRFVASARHSMEALLIPYTNDIACQIGVKPNLLKLVFTDPALFSKVLFGPCVAYQFRINGPHSWTGARQAIMSVWTRVDQPLKTRQVPSIRKNSNWTSKILIVITAGAMYYFRTQVSQWFFLLNDEIGQLFGHI